MVVRCDSAIQMDSCLSKVRTAYFVLHTQEDYIIADSELTIHAMYFFYIACVTNANGQLFGRSQDYISSTEQAGETMLRLMQMDNASDVFSDDAYARNAHAPFPAAGILITINWIAESAAAC